jgi:FKBP-type peptidyl-prolyl cis-trans isomerase SlyD
MNISNQTVVSFHYTLKDEDGTQLETSRDDHATQYLHGANSIIRGLEQAMSGREAGESFEVTVDAIDGYGLRSEASSMRVPAKHLVHQGKLKRGQVVSMQTDQGKRTVVVIKVGRHMVDVDTNHPLAGKVLNFEVEITDVRAATEEEASHGHAHGIGGHQH